MKTFTYASAFAGIGGMTLGLKNLGGNCVMAWEYDPTNKKRQYAQEAHRLLHPEITVHGDIHEADPSNMPDFDLFCFTPPCQAFSTAGKRGGFSDTRGTLVFEALRITNAKKPKVLFMENVKGLVSHDEGNTMSTIIHAINEIGYTVDFSILNSKYFDVGQNRERVYLVAIRDDLIEPEAWKDNKGTKLIDKAKRRYQDEGARTFNFEWPKQEEVRQRLKDILETDVDEKYYLSEERTASLVAQLELRGLQQTDKIAIEGSYQPETSKSIEQRYRVWGSDGVSGAILATMYKQPQTVAIDTLNINESNITENPIMLGHVDLNGHDLLKRVYSAEAICPTLTSMSGGNTEPKIAVENTTSRLECVGNINPSERGMSGKVYSINAGLSPTLVTGSVINIAEELILSAKDEKSSNKHKRYRIRKLTPRECLRLQSIPEDSIDIILNNFSNSRAYKFAGNGLTINVIKAIGEQLIKYL